MYLLLLKYREQKAVLFPLNKILNTISYAKELVNWGKTQLLLP